MRKISIRAGTLLGILCVLFVGLSVLVQLYPYPLNFPAYPRITRTQSGAAGDPINVVFVGSKGQIEQSFHKAGWLIPDPITAQTSARIAADSLAHRSYPTAPVSNLYVFGRVQDLAFEQPTTDVQYRGHIRIWKTAMLIGGQSIWVGAATYDSGIELSSTTHFPTHHIAPTVDVERNAVGSDLVTTGLVRDEEETTFTPPLFFARNGGGDYYESDGNVLLVNYTHAPIPVYPSVGGVDGLKTLLFLLYDTLFSVVGALLVFLSLVVVLSAGLVLWEGVARAKKQGQKRDTIEP